MYISTRRYIHHKRAPRPLIVFDAHYTVHYVPYLLFPAGKEDLYKRNNSSNHNNYNHQRDRKKMIQEGGKRQRQRASNGILRLVVDLSFFFVVLSLFGAVLVDP